MRRGFKQLCGAGVALSLLLGLGSVALAGSNGQELVYIPSCTANWALTIGDNQNGVNTERWVEVPAALPENDCVPDFPVYDTGHWWKGSIQVQGYWSYPPGVGYAGRNWYNVPVYQDNNNWFWVAVPGEN